MLAGISTIETRSEFTVEQDMTRVMTTRMIMTALPDYERYF